MNAMYAPARTSSGEFVFPGLALGTELDLGTFAGAEPRLTQTDLFTYVVYNNPKWDLMTFDIDKGLAQAETRKAGKVIQDDGTAVEQIIQVLVQAKVL